MKLVGEIFGGVLVLAFLAFKAGWLEAGTLRSLAASLASNAPDPATISIARSEGGGPPLSDGVRG